MPTDPRLLTLTQWLSPAYPLGAFAYSHGLEAAVDAGWVTDGPSLERWLEDVLADGSGRVDAWFVAHALAGEVPDAELDALARAYMPSAERLREAERQGAAFAQVTAEVWGLVVPAMLMPVALGSAARQAGLPGKAVIALYLQSFAGNLVAAAQRLLPLGQTEAQAIWARLSQTCAEIGANPPEALWSNGFLSDIASMKHEILQARVFQT